MMQKALANAIYLRSQSFKKSGQTIDYLKRLLQYKSGCKSDITKHTFLINRKQLSFINCNIKHDTLQES